MTSVDPTLTTTLTANLQPPRADAYRREPRMTLIARATRARWSPTVVLETLVQAELDARARRRLERQLQAARLGRFKPLADFEWDWPKQLHRPTVDRVFSLDFIAKGENVVLVASQGLGKTMLTKNLLHQAVLAGHSALFITASDLLLDLNGQETSRALERRLRAYARPADLGHRRNRLSGLRRPRGRPAVSSHQSPLRTTLDRRDHQFALQAMGHGLSRTRPAPSR